MGMQDKCTTIYVFIARGDVIPVDWHHVVDVSDVTSGHGRESVREVVWRMRESGKKGCGQIAQGRLHNGSLWKKGTSSI